MANQPSLIPSAWAANNSTTETIPATTTESGKASWDQGFPVETSLPLSEGGIPPKYGDFNGVLNVLSQFCLFAQAGGQFTWNSTLSYSVGSIVVGSDGSIYRAVQTTTNVNPVGDTSGKWERIVSKSDIDALETDIQTAMTNAENAVSNASAAQSAVSTLDANVVKLSGDQTVGGTKTFSSSLKFGLGDFAFRSGDTSYLGFQGGSADGNGAIIRAFGKDHSSNPGFFFFRAKDATQQTDMVGKPDGTLTWSGKGFVYDSGDQTIAGVKTFTSTMSMEKSYPLFTLNRTYTGSAPSDPSDLRFANNGTNEAVIRLSNGNSFQIGTKGSGTYWYNGPTLTLGKDNTFSLKSGYGSTTYDLKGSASGRLTWDGKDIITNGDDQTIAGTKTFSSSVYTEASFLCKQDFAFGTWPSSTVVPGVGSKDKNDLTGSWIGFRYTSTLTSLRLFLRKSDDSSTAATSLPYVEFAYGKDTGVYFWAPKTDNACYLGYTSSRWKQLYAGTTTISTSDERLKDNISAVPDAVLDAWGDVQWSQFQFNDAITEKGADKARLHNGLIAQRIDAAFKAHGLDASRYGLFCYDEWDATPEEKDEQGNVCEEAKPAGNIYSLRYEEALCMEAAYQRRRADRAEARITALERRLNEMEAAIASLISPVGDETYAGLEREQDAEQEGEE